MTQSCVPGDKEEIQYIQPWLRNRLIATRKLDNSEKPAVLDRVISRVLNIEYFSKQPQNNLQDLQASNTSELNENLQDLQGSINLKTNSKFAFQPSKFTRFTYNNLPSKESKYPYCLNDVVQDQDLFPHLEHNPDDIDPEAVNSTKWRGRDQNSGD